MKTFTICLGLVLACLCACSSKPAVSEDTAPTGTWSGDYGPDSSRRESITVDLRWEGTDLKGSVHAGTRSLPLTKTAFQQDTGAITMEFEAQGNGGQVVHYTIEGKVAGNTMVGVWTHDNQHGDFKVTKQ